MTLIQKWTNLSSLAEFENFLASQESLTKQMAGVSFRMMMETSCLQEVKID